jgi:hypothetical protein
VVDCLLDLLANSHKGDAERHERPRRKSVAIVDQTQEKAFGADGAAVQETGFLLGEDQDPTSLGREALEHDAMVRTGPTGVIAGTLFLCSRAFPRGVPSRQTEQEAGAMAEGARTFRLSEVEGPANSTLFR